ncbi:MAG: PEP-CTERM sorting domain-containing protein [Planctomycetota bacterium]
MLKKSVVMLVVCGLAASAFAILAIQPVVGGQTEIEVYPSDVFYVDLMWLNDVLFGSGVTGQTNGELTSADMHLLIQGPATIVDVNALTLNVDYTGAAGGVNPSDQLGGVFSVYSWGAGANPGEIIIDHIGIHCDAIGDVIITVSVSGAVQGISTVDWEHPLDVGNGGPGVTPMQLIVHQIPEPMTIALLGLGGLFLRRRK